MAVDIVNYASIKTHCNHHYQQYYHNKSMILFSGWNSLFRSISWLREGISQWTGDTCRYDDDDMIMMLFVDICSYDVDIMMIWCGYNEDIVNTL